MKTCSSPVLANSRVPPIADGSPATIPAKMMMDMPLPMPRSLTCSPSHMRNIVPATSVVYRRDSETPAGVHDHLKGAGLLRFECNRNPEGLKHREGHRAVSRISRDLPATRLSFFPKLLQTRVHVRKELHDDGCRNIRHDSDCKNRESFKRSPRKHVEHVEDRAPLLIEQHFQGNGINSGHRNERADSEHDQRAENEQQALLEFG